MRMPHFPVPSWQQNIKYGLDNIKKLSAILDNPHLRLPPVIHIAGTNGKGSSVAALKSIFESAGYQVHAYTSPHLLEFNERIVVRGEKISDAYLSQLCERVRIAAEGKVQPTFFEGTSAVAFLAFAEMQADILILETGLGGRLDATNIVPRPLITLITPISYDHKEYLGDKLTDIAMEKAGIIKPNVPCVISSQTDEVYQVLLAKCQELNSPAFCYEYDFGLKKSDKGFSYLSNNANYEFSKPSLIGDHQLINAASVIATIGLINKQFNITNKNIEDGLQNIKWPARIEKIPLTKYANITGSHIQIWVDGAHNAGGAKALSAWITDNLSSPIYLILGMTKNRDVEEFCSYFKLLIKRGYGVKVLSEVMSYNSETVSSMASKSGIDFLPADSLEEALREISNFEQEKTNIIITGSLYLAADFLKLIA